MEENAKQGNTKQTSGLSIGALVLGIIAVVLAFIPIINNLAFVLGIIGLVLAIIALIKKKNVQIAIVSVVLAVGAIGITLLVQKSASDAVNQVIQDLNKISDDIDGKNTDSILKNDINVSLGKFTVIKGEYFDDTKLEVNVTNKLSEKKSFSIKIEAVDDDGDRILDDTVYVSDLGAGQSQKLEAFTFVASDKMEDLKTATFKIFEVAKY